MVQAKLEANKGFGKMVTIKNKRIKKILILLPVSWGGVVHTTLAIVKQLCTYLKENNVKIYIVKPKDKYSNTFKLLGNVIVIDALKPIIFTRDKPFLLLHPYNIIVNIVNYLKMKYFVESIRPNIVYLVAPYPIFLLLRNELKNSKVILTVHAIFPQIIDVIRNMGILNGFLYLLSEYTIRELRSNTIIVHTKNDKILLRSKFSLNSKIVCTSLPILLPSSNTLASSYSPKYKGKRKLVLLNFGYIVPGKGIEILLKSLKIICSNDSYRKKVIAIIAGEGHLPRDVIKILQEIQKMNCKIFIINKHIPEKYVQVLFNYADIIVLPYTFHKGFSGVLRLALEFGKPVLASSAGDLPELIAQGKIGIIFKNKDHTDLARKLEYILEHEHILEILRRNIEKYRQSLMKSSYPRIFYELLVAE